MFCRRHVIGGILSTSAIGLLSLTGAAAGRAAAHPPLVAAAASLRSALPEVAAAFAAESGFSPRFSFGSSGNLARQIRQGAPFELFLSADEILIDTLAQARLTKDRGVLYALGRLALFVPRGSPISPDRGLAGVSAALEQGELRRFAIPNPEHAPYGRAAREALQHAKIWDAIGSRLVLGENVSQTAQFAATGSSDGALISQSLAVAPEFAGQGVYEVIAEKWHSPIRHRMALLPAAGDHAKRFFSFLGSAKAREVFARYGFSDPGEE